MCGCNTSTMLPIGPQGLPGTNGTNGINGLYGGWSSNWLYDNNTSNTPAIRTFRMNNINPTLVTSIYINSTNANSINIAQFVASFNNSGNFGWIRVFDEHTPTIFSYYYITATSISGSVTTLTVTYVSGSGTFINTNSTVISFTPIASNSSPLFKYIKVFTTDDTDLNLTISYAELTTCGVPSLGCIDDPGDTEPFVNFHLQCWYQLASGGSPNPWQLLSQQGLDGHSQDYTTSINPTTGLITINTQSISPGNWYIVLLG